jgi:S-disulfanyl-L-cysteine oxidoreductase SoxD
MKFQLAIAGVLVVWTLGMVHGTQEKPASEKAAAASSTWAGVYTEAQAELGLASYTKTCSECHGADLGGDGFAPGLKGPEFMNNWNGLSVGELHDRIRTSMPPTDPNSVTPKEKVDIVAYLLKENGFPTGATELPATPEALKGIKFEATKPGRN